MALIKTKCGINIIVDDEDCEFLKGFVWHIGKCGDPSSWMRIDGSSTRIKMKTILKNVAKTGKRVHYIDGNPLNNKKENLTFTRSTFEIHDGYAEMISPCKTFRTKIDKSMIGALSFVDWTYLHVGYVCTNIDDEVIYLHRFIMNAGMYSKKERIVVDHINGNSLDNRSENLRVCTEQENNFNSKKRNPEKSSSKYKGVYWNNKYKYWTVNVTLSGEEKYSEIFTNEVAGANAYNYYSKIFHGEFTKVNDVIYMNKECFERYIYKRKKSSKYDGITYMKHRKKWYISFKYRDIRYRNAISEDEKECLEAYNNFIIEKNIDRPQQIWRGYSKESCEND